MQLCVFPKLQGKVVTKPWTIPSILLLHQQWVSKNLLMDRLNSAASSIDQRHIQFSASEVQNAIYAF